VNTVSHAAHTVAFFQTAFTIVLALALGQFVSDEAVERRTIVAYRNFHQPEPRSPGKRFAPGGDICERGTRIITRLPAAAIIALICAQAAPTLAYGVSFRGTYTCDQLPTTRDVLRVPVRFIVQGDSVRFTRPLLDLDGNRRGVEEVARGSVNRHGELRLRSRWGLFGNVAHGDYRGRLTEARGTPTGPPTWPR